MASEKEAAPAGGDAPAYDTAPRLNVLALLLGPTVDGVVGGERRGAGAVEELAQLYEAAEGDPQASVNVVRYPKLEELASHLRAAPVDAVYLGAGVEGTVDGQGRPLGQQALSPLSLLCDAGGDPEPSRVGAFLEAFKGLQLACAYLDAPGCAGIAEALRGQGVQSVVCWGEGGPPPALPAMHFARAFFGLLRTPHVTIPEAYAIAARVVRTHCALPSAEDGAPAPAPAPALPLLLAPSEPSLPGNASIPPLLLPPEALAAAPAAAAENGAAGPADAENGAAGPADAAEPAAAGGAAAEVQDALPGYRQARLLAPQAELRLLEVGLSTLVAAPEALTSLCEALRALLATEVRRAQLLSIAALDAPPAHLPAGAAAARCDVRTASGAGLTVVLSAPPEVLGHRLVVEHALRQTLVADAHMLQLKLPPVGAPLPAARAVPAVACGAPVVELLAATSVWAVQLLKELAAAPSSRALVSLGVAAVSNTPVAAFARADANRYSALLSGGDPAVLERALQGPPAGAGPPAAPADAAAQPQSMPPPPPRAASGSPLGCSQGAGRSSERGAGPADADADTDTDSRKRARTAAPEAPSIADAAPPGEGPMQVDALAQAGLPASGGLAEAAS